MNAERVVGEENFSIWSWSPGTQAWGTRISLPTPTCEDGVLSKERIYPEAGKIQRPWALARGQWLIVGRERHQVVSLKCSQTSPWQLVPNSSTEGSVSGRSHNTLGKLIKSRKHWQAENSPTLARAATMVGKALQRLKSWVQKWQLLGGQQKANGCLRCSLQNNALMPTITRKRTAWRASGSTALLLFEDSEPPGPQLSGISSWEGSSGSGPPCGKDYFFTGIV